MVIYYYYYTTILLLLSTVAPLFAASSMRSARAGLSCSKPFTTCVKIVQVDVPSPKSGQALIKLSSSSINPSDVDEVEMDGCLFGCGNDMAGTVVSCNGCSRLKKGDHVWGFANPSFADFVTAPEDDVALRPSNVPKEQAGTIPEVGLTSLFSLKRTNALPGTPMPAGSPWANRTNVTVVITAGSGGTGFIGIEIAKVYGATNIVTSTTGEASIAFVKSLGATRVIDYKVEDIFAALPDDSVDFVYDNYGADNTADKAMRTLRKGGTYLMMPHGECYVSKKQAPPCISAHPKPGVRQVNYITSVDFQAHALDGLKELTSLFEENKLTAHVAISYELNDIALALNYSAGGGEGGVNNNHFGKIAVVMRDNSTLL